MIPTGITHVPNRLIRASEKEGADIDTNPANMLALAETQ